MMNSKSSSNYASNGAAARRVPSTPQRRRQQQQQQQRSACAEAVDIAENWIGKTVSIHGVGGFISVVQPEGNRQVDGSGGTGAAAAQVMTSRQTQRRTFFAIERAPESLLAASPAASAGAPNAPEEPPPTRVCFRCLDDGKYLTVVMYGDEVRQATCEALARTNLLLPEHVGGIVNFLVAPGTKADNFEGEGYCYQPMTVEAVRPRQRPNMLQCFELEDVPTDYRSNRVGIRTAFGTYWRSEHWNMVVSQAPHCQGDEQWHFQEMPADH